VQRTLFRVHAAGRSLRLPRLEPPLRAPSLKSIGERAGGTEPRGAHATDGRAPPRQQNCDGDVSALPMHVSRVDGPATAVCRLQCAVAPERHELHAHQRPARLAHYAASPSGRTIRGRVALSTLLEGLQEPRADASLREPRRRGASATRGKAARGVRAGYTASAAVHQPTKGLVMGSKAAR